MEKPIELLPVQLHVKGSTWRLHDAFLWPSAGAAFSPEEFAAALVKDNGLPEEAIAVVAKKLSTQIARLSDVWDRKWSQLAENETAQATCHVCIMELRVELGELVLQDRFEWDVNNLNNSPEDFARVLAADFGLRRDQETTLAHAVRSQLFVLWEQQESEMVSQKSDLATIRESLADWTPRLEAKPTPLSREERQVMADREHQQKLQDRRDRSRIKQYPDRMDLDDDDDDDDDDMDDGKDDMKDEDDMDDNEDDSEF